MQRRCYAEILLRVAILDDKQPPTDSESAAALGRCRKAAEENSALDAPWPKRAYCAGAC